MKRLHWTRRALPALLVLALAFAAKPAAARNSDWGRKHETWNWSGTLAAGKTLEVFGVNGNIEAVAGSGSTVRVVAEKSGRRQDPSEVRIEVVPWEGGVTICAVYPGYGNACEPHSSHSHTRNNDVNVDFHLEVPAGVAVTMRTVNGSVEARDLSAPVHAATVNGHVEIETSKSGDATTVNGSVVATLGKVRASDALEFNTVNGSITLNLPDDLDADVQGNTVNGGIHSDFPVEVTGRWGPRSVRGTLGRGGASLHMSTVNGGISLNRSH